MVSIEDLHPDVLGRHLAYAGFVLVAFEIVKSMIVDPIKAFYRNTKFGPGMPFDTYHADVTVRHKNEFEACLLYLRDHMEALDADDVITIQALRRHRNDLAHNLASQLPSLRLRDYQELWNKVDRTIFKLSNYRADMEVGADPEFRGIDWATVSGGEYLLFAQVVQAVNLLNDGSDGACP